MKRVLITGKSGYIAGRFEAYLGRFPEQYRTASVSLRDEAWTRMDFSQYDAVVHTAGLAHIKETAENAGEYYAVNRDLAEAAAKKAKAESVGQFLLLSSGSVYGVTEGVITADTKPHPCTHYGKSKFQGEEAVVALRAPDFKVAVLRPLMVYGEGCKGNYQSLIKLARIAPVLPDYQNRRSLVSIETLCACMKDVIDREAEGIFFPQEEKPLCTCEMLQEIAESLGRHPRRFKLLNPAVSLLRRTTAVGRKAFGDLVYQDLQYLPFDR